MLWPICTDRRRLGGVICGHGRTRDAADVFDGRARAAHHVATDGSAVCRCCSPEPESTYSGFTCDEWAARESLV